MGPSMILIVEDNTDDAELMRRAFGRAWVNEAVTLVRSGEEALAYFKGEGQYADRGAFALPRLVLLDLRMPGVDGFDVLAWLRGEPKFKGLPVIVVTGSDYEKDVARAYQMGANSFVVKRAGWENFDKDVREVIKFWLGACVLPASSGRDPGVERAEG